MPGCRLRDAPAQPRQPLPRLGDSVADAGPDLDLCAQELRRDGADLRLDRRRAILEDLRRRIVGKVARHRVDEQVFFLDADGERGARHHVPSHRRYSATSASAVASAGPTPSAMASTPGRASIGPCRISSRTLRRPPGGAWVVTLLEQERKKGG